MFSKSTNSIWIFGYGSLVHTPGFEVRRRVKGYVRCMPHVLHLLLFIFCPLFSVASLCTLAAPYGLFAEFFVVGKNLLN